MSFKVGVVIVCAGRGRRLGKADKAILKLKGKLLFSYALKIFQGIKVIKQIILVLRKKHFKRKEVISAGKDKKVVLVKGGKRRQDSVYNGLISLGKEIDYVLIHDGARPFVSKKTVLSLLSELKKEAAVICGIEPSDTVKLVKRGFVTKTLRRKDVFLIQTPQGFKKKLILMAYKKFRDRRIFDDAQALELMGKRVKVIKGDIRNFKITYPQDVSLAKAMVVHSL